MLPLRRLLRDDHGVGTIDHIVLLVLVVLTSLGVWRLFGRTVVRLITGD